MEETGVGTSSPVESDALACSLDEVARSRSQELGASLEVMRMTVHDYANVVSVGSSWYFNKTSCVWADLSSMDSIAPLLIA